MRTYAQLDHFTEEDLAVDDRLDMEDAEAADRIAVALAALREKSGRDLVDWAEALGIEADEVYLMENAQTVDRPPATFLLRAVLLCGGKLKISFGKNEKALEI